MNYRLDLHIHTDRSPDSRMTLPEAVKTAKKKGIHAIAVCDHNRCAPQEVFDCRMQDGILRIPGVEYSTEAGHLLGLFLKTPCRVEGEESGRVLFADAAEAIHAAGGKCVLAHPFETTHRSTKELSAMIFENRKLLDGIEIFNCRATKKRRHANELALDAAQRFADDIVQTAGSDAHTVREVGNAYVEVEADELTADALCRALRSPKSYFCGKCPHMAFAKSRLTFLQKKHYPFKSYVKWFFYAGVCFLRSVKGVFQ